MPLEATLYSWLLSTLRSATCAFTITLPVWSRTEPLSCASAALTCPSAARWERRMTKASMRKAH